MPDEGATAGGFDFAEHERAAIAAYARVRAFYELFAAGVARVIEECISARAIKVHLVQFRAKQLESFGRKDRDTVFHRGSRALENAFWLDMAADAFTFFAFTYSTIELAKIFART